MQVAWSWRVCQKWCRNSEYFWEIFWAAGASISINEERIKSQHQIIEVSIFYLFYSNGVYLTKQLHFELPQFNRNQFLDLSSGFSSSLHWIFCFFILPFSRKFASFHWIELFKYLFSVSFFGICMKMIFMFFGYGFSLQLHCFRLAWIIHKMCVVGTFQDEYSVLFVTKDQQFVKS